MPLLSATGATAEHYCLGCGAEARVTPAPPLPPDAPIPPGHWRLADESVVCYDCPTCGATECFQWTDWVYVRSKPPVERAGRLLAQPGFDPDSDHSGARQMVLIGRVAQALGRTRAEMPDQRAAAYSRPPRAPTREEALEYARSLRGG